MSKPGKQQLQKLLPQEVKSKTKFWDNMMIAAEREASKTGDTLMKKLGGGVGMPFLTGNVKNQQSGTDAKINSAVLPHTPQVVTQQTSALVNSHDLDRHISAVTLPASAGAVVTGGAHLSIGGAPYISGIGSGCRLVCSYEGPALAAPAISGAFCKANGWVDTPTDDCYMGVFLNPAQDQNRVTIITAPNATCTSTIAPMARFVPKFGQIARCFNRFRFRLVRIDSIGTKSTATDGAFRLASITDPMRMGELNFDFKTQTVNTAFNWVSNQETGTQGPVWVPELSFTAVSDVVKGKKGFRKIGPSDLFYTMLGLDSTATLGLSAIDGALALRSSIQGVVLGAQDKGETHATLNTVLRRNYWHVVVDLYELNLGAPINGNIRSTVSFDKKSLEENKLLKQTDTLCESSQEEDVDESSQPMKPDESKSTNSKDVAPLSSRSDGSLKLGGPGTWSLVKR